MVGIYHSRWRAVAARGTRQFTADRRSGGLVVLPVGHRSTRLVDEDYRSRERSLDRSVNSSPMGKDDPWREVGGRFVRFVQCHVTPRA